MRIIDRIVFIVYGLILLTCSPSALAQKKSPAENCYSRGAIDSKTHAETTENGWEISGWAYDARGISFVRFISSSGEFLGAVRPNILRKDVSEALPHCPHSVNSGFSLIIPSSRPTKPISSIRIEGQTSIGERFKIGSIETPFTQPIAVIEEFNPIHVNGRNIISGWAFEGSTNPLLIRILAKDVEIIRQNVAGKRADVGNVFRAWPSARISGFQFVIPFRQLLRGRYKLKIEVIGSKGIREFPGPEVINDQPIGIVRSDGDRLINPKLLDIAAWGFDEDGVTSAEVETESGILLGRLPSHRKDITLTEFEIYRKSNDPIQNPKRGTAYRGRFFSDTLPQGIHRINVRLQDAKGNNTLLPGPIVMKFEKVESSECKEAARQIYLPGGHAVFQQGFTQLTTLRAFSSGCLAVGIRGRVEYLRTTRGEKYDFAFDPAFPESLRSKNGREMTGESLDFLLSAALQLKVPLLITLDGGVWADSKFSAPEVDIVDNLENDEATVQWNQHNRSEEDNALQGLAGSVDDPQLARMMTLNRFNARYLAYKKRNLQAAVHRIVAFTRDHPEILVKVNLDPDLYINPWFYLQQWYDYNPDTLRQFREWLFHLGPYADGEKLADSRYKAHITLANLNRITGCNYRTKEEVEPPRTPPDYSSEWHQIWTQFKRHLVTQHYEDLALWVKEAGLPSEHIYTSQTFIQADVSVTGSDPATGWTDEAGVSIRGAKPQNGHIGAILYGPASRNEGGTRNRLSLIDNIRVIDKTWGAVEFHPATIAAPEQIPSHAESYRSLLEMINGGARFLSPMWGSHARDQQVRPERFRSYDAFEGTPFEYQLLAWMDMLRRIPGNSLIFPFGNTLVTSSDGWLPLAQTKMKRNYGFIELEGQRVGIKSPNWHDTHSSDHPILHIKGSWPGYVACVTINSVGGKSRICAKSSPNKKNMESNEKIVIPITGEIPSITLVWDKKEPEVAASVRVDDIRLDLRK